MKNVIFDTNHLYRTYFKMAFPVVLGLLVTLIYNLADTFFIAQTNNTYLIAGVSICTPVFSTLMAFGNIYGQGGSSLISRLLGQKDLDGTRRISSFCFYIAILTGTVLAVLMMLFRHPLLTILGATSDTVTYASQYYSVLAVCSPIVALSFIHSNLIRCEGLAFQAMLGNIIGTVINIILDPILIFGLGMGARGAAFATVIGYLCTDIYFLVFLYRKKTCLSVNLADCHISSQEFTQVFGVGITAALTNLMQSLTVIVLNQSLLSYGNDKIAAMGIVLKINMIAQLVLTGFAFGAVPLFGYLYGAGLKSSIKKLIRFCFSFLSILSLFMTLALFLASEQLMGLFVSDPAIISIGSTMLRWQVISTIFAGIVLLLTVLFQATGKLLPAFLMSISRQGVVFLLTLLVCVSVFHYTGILAAQAVADILSAILALVLLWKDKILD